MGFKPKLIFGFSGFQNRSFKTIKIRFKPEKGHSLVYFNRPINSQMDEFHLISGQCLYFLTTLILSCKNHLT